MRHTCILVLLLVWASLPPPLASSIALLPCALASPSPPLAPIGFRPPFNSDWRSKPEALSMAARRDASRAVRSPESVPLRLVPALGPPYPPYLGGVKGMNELSGELMYTWT